MVKQHIQLTPITSLKSSPFKQGIIRNILSSKVCEILGFKPNCPDDDRVANTWAFKDEKGNEYMIWRYKVAITHSVYGNKELLNKLFNNQIEWFQ